MKHLSDKCREKLELATNYILREILVWNFHFLTYNEQCFTKWIKSCLLPCFGTFKMPFLMFISILVFRPEGQI